MRVEDDERRREQADRGEQRHRRAHVGRRRAERRRDVLRARTAGRARWSAPARGRPPRRPGRRRPRARRRCATGRASAAVGRRAAAVGRCELGGGLERASRSSGPSDPGAGPSPARIAGDRDRDRAPRRPRSVSVVADVEAVARGEPLGDERLGREPASRRPSRGRWRGRGRGARAARSMPRTVTGSAPSPAARARREERPPLDRRARRRRRPGRRRRRRACVPESPASVKAATRRSARPIGRVDRALDRGVEPGVDGERRHQHGDADRDPERRQQACARAARRGCARRRGRDRAWVLWPRRLQAELREPLDERARPSGRRGGRGRSRRGSAPSPITSTRSAYAAAFASWVTSTIGLAAVDARAPQGVEDPEAGREVEVAGRLVGEQERRAGDDRARDGDALLLARGQLIGAMALLAGQLDQRDRVADPVGERRPERGSWPAIVNGRPTFSTTFSSGTRLNDWNTKPVSLAPQARRLVVGQPADRLALEDAPRRTSAGRARRAAGAACSCRIPTGPSAR